MKWQVTVVERVTKEVWVDADNVSQAENQAAIGNYTLKEEIDVECVYVLADSLSEEEK